MQVKSIEHSALLATFIKLSFVFKTFVLSIFEWQLKTGFTVVQVVCCCSHYDLGFYVCSCLLCVIFIVLQ